MLLCSIALVCLGLVAAKVILGDATGIVRLELWGNEAKRHDAALTAVEETGFPEVAVTGAEVCLPRIGSFNQAKTLQFLPSSTLEVKESDGDAAVDLAGVQNAAVVAKEFVGLTTSTPPFQVMVTGVVKEVETLQWTREDVPQRWITLLDDKGYGLKILQHGYWSEESMSPGQKWLLSGVEVKLDRDGKGTCWQFDNAYCLKISEKAAAALAFRELVSW